MDTRTPKNKFSFLISQKSPITGAFFLYAALHESFAAYNLDKLA